MKIIRYTLFRFVFIYVCFSGITLNAQKYDYNWIGGFSKGDTGEEPAFMLKFNKNGLSGYDSIQVLIVPRDGQITISDPNDGSLLFYTNGNFVANSRHEIMDNGIGLNAESPWRGNERYYTQYGIYCYLVLPNLYREGLYYLIHPTLIPDNEYHSISGKLLISEFDMNKNDGLGKVNYKDSVILDHRTSARFSAVMHGNGKDWWIITRDLDGRQYRLLLLRDGEIVLEKVLETEDPGPYLKNREDSLNTSNLPYTISPSGDLILERQGTLRMRVLGFDRCKGEMAYINHFIIPKDTYTPPKTEPPSPKKTLPMGFFVVSANNKFAYAWGANGLYQWDLTVNDISSSRTKLFGPPIVLDRFQNETPYQVYAWSFPAYGPDGRIYYLWRRNHYIINNPNEEGTSSDVIGPRALEENLYIDSPNYPNYRLGPLRGSACDTLISGRQNKYSTSTFKVFPNPTSGPLTIELDLQDWDGEDVVIAVYDALGRQVYRHLFARWSYLHQINPGELLPGVYFIRLDLGGVAVQTQRIVVQ